MDVLNFRRHARMYCLRHCVIIGEKANCNLTYPFVLSNCVISPQSLSNFFVNVFEFGTIDYFSILNSRKKLGIRQQPISGLPRYSPIQQICKGVEQGFNWPVCKDFWCPDLKDIS